MFVKNPWKDFKDVDKSDNVKLSRWKSDNFELLNPTKMFTDQKSEKSNHVTAWK